MDTITSFLKEQLKGNISVSNRKFLKNEIKRRLSKENTIVRVSLLNDRLSIKTYNLSLTFTDKTRLYEETTHYLFLLKESAYELKNVPTPSKTVYNFEEDLCGLLDHIASIVTRDKREIDDECLQDFMNVMSSHPHFGTKMYCSYTQEDNDTYLLRLSVVSSPRLSFREYTMMIYNDDGVIAIA